MADKMARPRVAMTSDCFGDTVADPRPVLRLLKEAGFEGVHVCHDWDTMRIIDSREVFEYWKSPIRDLNLKAQDLHASDGRYQIWSSDYPPAAEWGRKLVLNRLEMAAILEARAIVLHAPNPPETGLEQFYDRVAHQFASLHRYAMHLGVTIALENTDTRPSNEQVIDMLLTNFTTSAVGLCIDTGHAHIQGGQWEFMEKWIHRVYALHVQDNLGPPPVDNPGKDMDEHYLPYNGTFDWARWIRLMAQSQSYDGLITLEVGYGRGRDLGLSELDWLKHCRDIAWNLYRGLVKERGADRIGHPYN